MKTCKQCGNEFQPTRQNRKLCSDECRHLRFKSQQRTSAQYAKARERQANIRARGRQLIYDYYKSNPCVDCGEDDPIVLEFDHCNGDKTYNISNMRSYKPERILAEIDKCEVVCANCHRRRTALKYNWYASL